MCTQNIKSVSVYVILNFLGGGENDEGEMTMSLKRLLCWSVAPSCPTLCDPMDCSPPGSSIRGILQAEVLEWVAISFSRGKKLVRRAAMEKN